MKFFSVLIAIAALNLPIHSTAALPAPHLTPLTETAVSIEQDSSSLLTSGELVLHVIRTDDLLSDHDGGKEKELVLERLTHLVLKVQLDKEDEKLVLNGKEIVLGGERERRNRKKVVVKSEALFLAPTSEHADKQTLTTEELASLLPPGIISAEVFVKEDRTPQSLLDLELPDSVEQTQAKISMKSYQVSLKIIEIESHHLSHETTLVVPILQIQLSYQSPSTKNGKPELIQMKAFAIKPSAKGSLPMLGEAEEGDSRVLGKWGKGRKGGKDGKKKMEKLKALKENKKKFAAGGRGGWKPGMKEIDVEEEKVVVDGHSHFNSDEEEHSHRHHNRPQSDDEDDEGRPHHHHPHSDDDGEDRPHFPHHRHHHGPPPFVARIASLLGWTPPPHPPHFRHHFHHHHSEEEKHGETSPEGSHEHSGERKHPHEHEHSGEKDGERRPHRHHKPTKGDEGEEEETSVRSSSSDDESSKPHRHHFHHHREGGRRGGFRRTRKLSCRIKHALRHPGVFLAFTLIKFVALIALVFVGVKKGLKAFRTRREGALRLEEEEEEVEVVEKGEKNLLG